jgi:predicted nuclease of predicted toxin-antitoxin system
MGRTIERCRVTLRFLIDENLSPDLTHIAALAGAFAVSVSHIGLSGTPDYKLMDIIERNDLVMVTNNAVDFRKLYAARPLHAGLVLILPAVPRPRQMLLFDTVLRYLENHSDLINTCLSIDVDGAITLTELHA